MSTGLSFLVIEVGEAILRRRWWIRVCHLEGQGREQVARESGQRWTRNLSFVRPSVRREMASWSCGALLSVAFFKVGNTASE
jgi:hypothetical protein